MPHKLCGHFMLSPVSCTVLGILLHRAHHVAFLFISRHNVLSGRFIHRVNQIVNKVLLLKLKYVLRANIQMIEHRQQSKGYVSVSSTISLMHTSHISVETKSTVMTTAFCRFISLTFYRWLGGTRISPKHYMTSLHQQEKHKLLQV